MTMGRTIANHRAAFAVCFVCIGLFSTIYADKPEIIKTTSQGEIGKSANINCTVYPDTANVTWAFKGKPIKDMEKYKVTIKRDQDRKTKTSTVTISNATASDAGNYTCAADKDGTITERHEPLDLYFPGKWLSGSERLKVNMSDKASVDAWCIFEVFNCTEVKWYKSGEAGEKTIKAVQISPRRIISNYSIPTHRVEDNGTYICEVEDGNTTRQGKVDVWIQAPPKVVFDTVVGISTTQIYLKWTAYLYNAKNLSYYLTYKNETMSAFEQYHIRRIPAKNTSFVMDGMNKSTAYCLKLEANTEFGKYESDNITVETLGYDPVFVPKISINGFSATSVTIGWKKPDERVAPFIHYYILEAKKKDENVSRTAYHSRDGRNLPYMFDNLEPHSTYIFMVRACSDYTNKCGNWSDKMEAATSDGVPTKPTSVKSTCSATFMNLSWAAPERPNAEIKGYMMELTGNATFRDRYGKEKKVTWGPLSKFTTNESRSVRFDGLQPNTHYTVRLSAMTRTRRRGDEAADECKTEPAPPDHPPRPRWRKIIQDDKYMFKMYMPRIAERNGLLCCYRVYMVRMPPQATDRSLPPIKDIKVLEHKDDQPPPTGFSAYITDIFSNDNYPHDSELVMGDERSQFNRSEPAFNDPICSRCLKRRRFEPTTTTTTTAATTTEELGDDVSTDEPEEVTTLPARRRRAFDKCQRHKSMVTKDGAKKCFKKPNTTTTTAATSTEEVVILPATRRRAFDIDKDFQNDPTLKDRPQSAGQGGDRDADFVYDRPLDASANYTLFVELITKINDEEPMYSDYVNILMPAPTPAAPQPASVLEIALQATCAVAAVVLLLMIVFCIRQTRRERKMPPHAPLEMNSLQAAFRNMFGRRAQHTPTAPPDMAPIPKDQLAAAYLERQADSDYGFQKEFEMLQMLPECFPDRTTHASEARENQPKNRYPDIKAYDQTRVKLAQIDSIVGSDYINANYVMGYQDRKQFICAQGPTDTTVNDFWRMIWEQGLELIVMLTNLEEYSKVKCSKYWPDDVRGSRNFGGLTVHHVTEKRYSDYIVRELKITKQPLNTDGQPIVEGNGIAKRNGDCTDASEGSAPTSPREAKDPETRIVKQYHFLMWKDFAAPEHAYSIIKFIKRVNEAWAGMLGRACVVHCSAGVGRTGTLVALDCLLEQLRAVGHAAVFNTVAELRRSRNFLVQSLKQYVFVYRALVEYAHHGDTEIPAHRLKASVDRLRNTPPHINMCLMELEFDKILDSPIPEPIKSCAAGAADELRPKNRSAEVLPYDRNRVILAPIPGRDYSTYINASFIEAYDNVEGFIITQDPMPSTIMDFWRMVSEHNVTTIVMLSEMGEGKCPRYWDDGTATYEHISVQYEESESCPYYTRRQFRVVDNKSGCTTCVRQLQYQGWPTAPGHVPEVTRGLAELADAAAPHSQGAMLVHCQLGTERSALFVALCILITQLRTERRVDVCCVARKVRSQRVKTINTFLQYEFLHRAILNYAELHNLLEAEES